MARAMRYVIGDSVYIIEPNIDRPDSVLPAVVTSHRTRMRYVVKVSRPQPFGGSYFTTRTANGLWFRRRRLTP